MDAIEKRALAQLAQLLQAGGCEGELRIGRKFGQALIAEIAALTPPEGEQLSESEKDVALAQAVELAEYVERQAKGAMVDAAKRFLSLPYAQELGKRLTPPEGYVLVPVELPDMGGAPNFTEGKYSRSNWHAAIADLQWLAARPDVP